MTEEYIEIKSYYLFFCFDNNKKYEYINIKGFQVDNGKDYRIVLLDNSNEKIRLFNHKFELEEAEYFVYVVNDLINKKKNL